MNCFTVEVLQPSGTILEIESCTGQVTNNLTIEQTTGNNLSISQCMAQLPSDINNTIISQINNHLVAGSGINIVANAEELIISTSDNYSIVGHQHIISDVSGLQIILDGKQPSGNYAPLVHSHLASDITNFNSSVSGLLPVKNIGAGSGIRIVSSSGDFVISVTGTFGLTGEQVDDRVSQLLDPGSYINLNYNDSLDSLTISATGLQPSGDYSIVGHNHTSVDITDFSLAVSGLLPNSYDSAVPWTANHTLVDGTRYLANDLVYENGRLYKANYDNESIPVSNTLYWTDVGPGYRLNIDGRDIPNIPYPVTNLTAGSGIGINNVDTDYIISVTGTFGLTGEEVDDRVSNLLTAGNYINLNYSDSLDSLTISVTGLQPSGNYSIDGHTHTASNITDFNSSVSGLLPVKNITAGSGIGVSNTSGDYTVSVTGTFGLTSEEVDDRVSGLLVAGNYINLNYNDLSNSLTISATGLQPSGNYSLVGHTHVYTDITNWANGVDSVVSTLLVAGTGISLIEDSLNDTLTIATSGVSYSGHSHISSDITDFNSSVSGLLPVKDILAGSGISVSSSSGAYTISANITGVILEEIQDNLGNNFLVAGNNIDLDYVDASGTLTINTVTDPTFDKIQLDLNAAPVLTQGQIGWNDTEGTIDIALTDDVTINIGEHSVYRVRNETGSVLYKGQVVYASGVHPNGIIEPNLYVADGTIREIRFIGLILENINDNNNGYAMNFGHISNIDTRGNVASPFAVGDETWITGDILYVHPTVPGKLTNIEPKHSIITAIILDAANNGKIFVRPTSYGHLSDNHDVAIIGATNGQFLQYNSSTDYWVPSSSGNFTNLNVNNTGVVVSSGGTSGYLSKFTNSNSLADSLIYDNGTNVGIGTTNPQALVHISGSSLNNVGIRIENGDGLGGSITADNGALYFNTSTSTACRMQGTKIRMGDGSSAAAIELTSNGSISQDGNGGGLSFSGTIARLSNGLHVTGGQVGIGTSTPSSRFHVIGSGIFSSGIIVGDNNTNGYVIGPSGNTYIKFNNSSNNWINIGSNSYTNSSTYLETQFTYLNGQSTYVNGTLQFPAAGNNPTSTATQQDSNTIRIFNKLWNGSGVVSPGNDIVSKASTTTNLESRLAFLMHNGDGTQNRTERLSILSNGNVGIGITAPSGQLHVVGTGIFSGNVLVNNIPVSVSGHLHSASDISDFNSSVSGLFPSDLVAGVGSSGYLTKWVGANSVSSGIVYDDGSNIGIGTATPSGLLDVAGNLTFNTFTEKVITNTNSGSGISLSIDSGTVHRITLTDNCSFTMPSAVAGKSFSMFLNTGSGNYTASFSGVLWSDSAPPTITTTANKVDILSFISDGNYWYGSYSQNYG